MYMIGPISGFCLPGQFIGIVCDHQTLDIRCPGNQKLRILSVFYGRVDKIHCIPSSPNYMANTNCRSSTAEQVIRNKCDGKKSCTHYVNGDTLEDPCFGTYKYLKVEYTCESELPTQLILGSNYMHDLYV